MTPGATAAEVRERARRFAAEEIAPHAGAWDRAEDMPRAIVTRLGELGFLAGPLPASVGGSGST